MTDLDHKDCDCVEMLKKTDVCVPEKCHIIHEDTLDNYHDLESQLNISMNNFDRVEDKRVQLNKALCLAQDEIVKLKEQQIELIEAGQNSLGIAIRSLKQLEKYKSTLATLDEINLIIEDDNYYRATKFDMIKKALAKHEDKEMSLPTDQIRGTPAYEERLENEIAKLKENYDKLYQEHDRSILYYENRIAKLKDELENVTKSCDFWCDHALTQKSTLDEVQKMINRIGVKIIRVELDKQFKEILAKHEDKK